MRIFLISLLLFQTHCSHIQKQRSVASDASSHSKTSSIDNFIDPKCQSSLKKMSKKYNTQPEWLRIVDPDNQTLAWRSPTKVVGTWLQVETDKASRIPTIKVLSAKNELTYKAKIDSKKCLLSMTSSSKMPTKIRYSVTDDQLAEIIQSDKGIIYIWSPSMSYSMRYLRTFETYARKLQIPFYVFMDPSANKRMVKMAEKTYRIGKKYQRKVASNELFMRLYPLYYPVTYVFARGKIHPERIIGVVSEQVFTHKLMERMHDLR